ncbi:MAG TPA: hypothetical protein VNT27_11225, partial [Propionibacteriaceae bacterium]|nr:hypothetical protein [Propionibacteriaceae bacterium]
MTASGTVRQRTPHGQALRRLVSRHPVATFLLMVFVISVVVAQVPVLTRRDILPFGLALSDSVGPVLGVAVPAFLVVAAVSGREGVRELASRSLRWRAGLRWYAFAFLSVPAGVLLCVGALYGRSLVVVLTDRWTALFTAVVPHLAILIICCIVAEEVGFMGFLQARW